MSGSQDRDKTKRGPGRPSTGGRDPLVALRLPPDTIAEMDAALIEGESRSDLIRDAVERELKRRAKRH